MNPVKLNITSQVAGLPIIKRPNTDETQKSESFAQTLKSFVQDVNNLQHDAAAVEKKFLMGDITDVHQVMLAAEEASVAFELLMEIRNKLIESYKEIIRTPA